MASCAIRPRPSPPWSTWAISCWRMRGSQKRRMCCAISSSATERSGMASKKVPIWLTMRTRLSACMTVLLLLLLAFQAEAAAVAVHHQVLLAREAHQRHASALRRRDRERGRGRHGGEQRHAGHRCLLHHLETRAAGDGDEAGGGIHVLRGKRTHQLVERVVASDVL